MNSTDYRKINHLLSADATIPRRTYSSSNNPASPSYGVYFSQLICYSRACAKYSDFSGQSAAADAKAADTRLPCS